jgi:peptidoglycan-associated lipoprotein
MQGAPARLRRFRGLATGMPVAPVAGAHPTKEPWMSRPGLLLLFAILATGCSSKPKPAVPEPTSASAGKRRGGDGKERGDAVHAQASDDRGNTVHLGPVYFDFDSTTLRPDARDELDRIADYLNKNPAMRLTVEGHCDEQGTTEYNVALGDRRARAIRAYLSRLGVSEQRLAVISYGEERPADSGDGETAWAHNRRGELVPDRP